jgi:hypothetical protein
VSVGAGVGSGSGVSVGSGVRMPTSGVFPGSVGNGSAEAVGAAVTGPGMITTSCGPAFFPAQEIQPARKTAARTAAKNRFIGKTSGRVQEMCGAPMNIVLQILSQFKPFCSGAS